MGNRHLVDLSSAGPHRKRERPRLMVLKPSEGPLDALVITDGRFPAQPLARFLGAVFQMATEQPGSIPRHSRRLRTHEQPALNFEEKTPRESERSTGPAGSRGGACSARANRSRNSRWVIRPWLVML